MGYVVCILDPHFVANNSFHDSWKEMLSCHFRRICLLCLIRAGDAHEQKVKSQPVAGERMWDAFHTKVPTEKAYLGHVE